MDIEQDIQNFIHSHILKQHNVRVPEFDEDLLHTGTIDSLSLLQVLGYIQEKYGVDLFSTCSPNDYLGIQAMADAIRRIRN